MKKGWIALLLFFVSCKSTESINRFAKSASEATAVIGRETPLFGAFCRLYNSPALSRFVDTSILPKEHRNVSDCHIYDQSDSLTNVVNQTLFNYFFMLQALSDKKLIAYNADNLVSSLQEIQINILPAISFSDEKVSAVKGLLNTMLNEPLKWYRHNKLVSTMRKTDSALQRVLSAYIFILDTALAGELNQARENFTSFVYTPMYEMSGTPIEKIIVNQSYNSFMSSRESELRTIQKSVGVLETIRKDHNLISFGKNEQTVSQTETEIANDVIKINNVVKEITQIHKQ